VELRDLGSRFGVQGWSRVKGVGPLSRVDVGFRVQEGLKQGAGRGV
jgi:hypothetical protein